MPEQFWSLTAREFWIKFRAFHRSECRAMGRVMRHALMTAQYKKNDRMRIERNANELMRYPVKPWLR